MVPFDREDFDPTIYTAEYVIAEVDEDIASILDKVEEGWTRTPNVILIIPRGARAFHTTQDFLSLGKLQASRSVRVSVASADPTIAGLARVLGFFVVNLPGDEPASPTDPGDENDIEKPTAPLPLGTLPQSSDWIVKPAPPPIKPSSLTTSAWLANPEAYLSSTDEGSNPWAGARTGSPARPGIALAPPLDRPANGASRSTGHLDPLDEDEPSTLADSNDNDDEDAEEGALPLVSTTPSGRIKARRVILAEDAGSTVRGLRYEYHGIDDLSRPIRWGRLFAIIAAVLVLALVVTSTYALVYLPEGRVAITPLNKTYNAIPIEVAVLTSPTGSGGSESKLTSSTHTISAIPVTAPITEEGSHQATGSRQVAHGRAQGTMHFTNRTGNPVSVPSGLRFKVGGGVYVEVTQRGTVPATIFGQSFGTLDLPIVATVDGPAGNLSEGQLAGTYAGVLDYRSSALQGGSLDTIQVVTQADIDSVQSDLQTRAQSDLAAVVLGMVAPGQQLITQTVALANVTYVSDHKAGEDGDSVQVKLTAEARAFVFRDADMHDAVVQSVQDWVATNVDRLPGPSLDSESVQYAPPLFASAQEGKALYTTTASGHVAFSLTPDLAHQIRDLVKGKDLQEARDLITRTYGEYVNTSAVQAKVLWFTLDHMPSDATHITVEASTPPGITPPNGAVPAPPAQGAMESRSSQP